LSTTFPVLLAAALTGGAVALMVPGGGRARIAAAVRPPVRRPLPAAAQDSAGAPPRRSAVLGSAGLAGLGLGLLVGGWTGVALGAGAGLTAALVLPRLEPRAVRQRRARLAADLPLAVDLLAACLVAGRPPTAALPAVAAAVGGALAAELDGVSARLLLGADPARVWRDVARGGGALASLGRTMARSLDSGAPVADGLRLLAADLRRRRRAAAEQRARGVGVRAAAPLGLCFLPAFLLVGVVPAVVTAFASLGWP
jgi:Flp pilus assembly protein TadB